jgi:transposase
VGAGQALDADGVSQREIAARLGMNRRTVRRLVEAAEPPRDHRGDGAQDARRTRRHAERLRVLRGVSSNADVRVYVHDPTTKAWRLLSLDAQRALWDARHRVAGP